MKCIHKSTTVIDSRKKNYVIRRRGCLECKERFTTYELSEQEMEKIKKDLRAIKVVKLFLKKIEGIEGIND